MSVWRRLLKVGSVADSMSIYVPAVVFHKGLGLLRVLVFVHFMRHAEAEYGLWQLSVMLFTFVAPLLTLGSNHGLVRYVSFYEARGRLDHFYRRARRGVLICAAGGVALAVLAAPGAARLLVLFRAAGTAGASVVELTRLCVAAAVNAFALALYMNMVGFLVGMRVYRLVAAVEILFSLAFVILGVAALAVLPTSLSLLAAHAGALVVALGAGLAALHAAAGRAGGEWTPREAKEAVVIEPTGAGDEVTGTTAYAGGMGDRPDRGVMARVLRFGAVAMVANLLWVAAQYVSFVATYLRGGEARAGIYGIYLQLSQATLFLANAAWAVVLTHVARRWEGRQHTTAMLVLETSYKAVAMTLMALTLAIYAAAPLWVRILPSAYQAGLPLLGGLLLFFQTVTHLALVTMLAKLHERPAAIAAAALAGGALNAILAWRWMSGGWFAMPAEGAAWAAGVGMFVGALVVAGGYVLWTRTRLRASTWFVLLSPAVLIGGLWGLRWRLVAVWGGVCLLALITPLLFDAREKRILLVAVRRVWGTAGKVIGRC
ncbi:MAG: hypothetical protein KGY99_01335 [Phycisphaerae bacterium]|nr:hypothetical protein [Phycisphaerae bacterium]